VMKMMLSSFVGHNMIAIGTQAMAGIGRNYLGHGKDDLAHQPGNGPMTSPSGTANRRGNGKSRSGMRRQLR